MPRDLGDVLHYFLPETGNEAEAPASASVSERPADALERAMPPAEAATPPPAKNARLPGPLPLIAVPFGDRDVVRAAFTWNLVVEAARMGGRAAVVAPASDADTPLWPRPGRGPLGAEVVLCPATGLGELYRGALDLAVERAAEADEGGVVFVRVPPRWLLEAGDGAHLLRWTLLFCSSDPRDGLDAYGLTKLVTHADPEALVGVAVHGARDRDQGEAAFARLAGAASRHLGRDVSSYGLLVDDLHVYRAIVANRPIGLAHPQSPAALALRDVAALVLSDARKLAVV